MVGSSSWGQIPWDKIKGRIGVGISAKQLGFWNKSSLQWKCGSLSSLWPHPHFMERQKLCVSCAPLAWWEGRQRLPWVSTDRKLNLQAIIWGLFVVSEKTVSYQSSWKFNKIYAIKEVLRITTSREHSKCFWPDFSLKLNTQLLVGCQSFWKYSHYHIAFFYSVLLWEFLQHYTDCFLLHGI